MEGIFWGLYMDIIEILKSVVLGIVQGITEWLPISSTGHMILFDEFVKLKMSAAFTEMFFVVIQLGSILAVIVLYWKKLLPIHTKKDRGNARSVWKPDTLQLWAKIIIACLPAAIVGIFLNDYVDALFYNWQTVSGALIVYGILFIVVESWNRKRTPAVTDLRYLDLKTAVFIGLFQVLALIPGTSRSGATILGGILVGTSRTVAAEFTFFLSIPMMIGVSLLKLVKFGLHFTGLEAAVLLVGVLVAFVVSMIAITFLMRFIKKHDFKGFGWYRIVLGVIVIAYFLIF
jgi:undecaprenyl-diphosphatase